METQYQHVYSHVDKTKMSARYAAQYAKQHGVLSEHPCIACGSETLIHMHHEDYEKPLDVTWLCRKCHNTLHGNRGDIGGGYRKPFRKIYTMKDLIQSRILE